MSELMFEGTVKISILESQSNENKVAQHDVETHNEYRDTK